MGLSGASSGIVITGPFLLPPCLSCSALDQIEKLSIVRVDLEGERKDLQGDDSASVTLSFGLGFRAVLWGGVVSDFPFHFLTGGSSKSESSSFKINVKVLPSVKMLGICLTFWVGTRFPKSLCLPP